MADMLKVEHLSKHHLEHTLESGSPTGSPVAYSCPMSSFEEDHSDSRDTVGSTKRVKLENHRSAHGKAHGREQSAQYAAVNKPPGEQFKTGELKTRKLACPYYKRHPRREGRPVACVHPGFSNVARLKEHLYRIHRLPIECPRCREQFNSDQERTDHLSAPERCTPQPRVSNMEGFDKEQELKLRTKKRSKGEGSEEEKWKAVFMILFPETSPGEVPSAYLETDISAPPTERTDQEAKVLNEFESFSDRHIRGVVKRLNQSSSVDPAQTDKQLIEILRKCQSELFGSFRRSEEYKGIIGSKAGASCVSSRPHSRASSVSKLSHDSVGIAGPEFYDAQEQKPN